MGLLAPRDAGSALIGPGSAEAQELLPWESAASASLFSDNGPSSALRGRLAGFEAAVAYTRSADLARNLAAAIPRVIVQDPSPPDGGGHVSRWLARALSQLHVAERAEEPPIFQATTAERDAAAGLRAELPARFLAVHPGSGSAAKSWPSDRFARLVHELDLGHFLVVEGPADAAAAAALDTRAAVVARGLAPRVLGALLGEAAAFVGNDSGVTHLAAAWGAPTVALFGPTDPDVWSPVGARVTIVRGPKGRMDGIEVGTVMGAIAPLLAKGTAGSYPAGQGSLPTTPNHAVTALLQAWGDGDLAARDRLFPLVYGDLRRRAAHYLRRERPGHTLQPTALVNEAYLRLAGPKRMAWTGRAHFLAVASQAMRRVLVDHARSKRAGKRWGHTVQVPLEEGAATSEPREVDLILLDESLDELASLAPDQARLVELRYFGGLTTEEAAEVLGVSPATVERRWNLARAWLFRRVTQGRPSVTRNPDEP